MSNEAALRHKLVLWGKSLFERGLTAGSSGNISVRLPDGYLMTPTNSCLGFLDEARISKLDPTFAHVAGDAPTKEIPLHRAVFEARPDAGAVVHLHSTYATALSCLADTDPDNAIAPITPYVVMRVGRVPILPYTRPGSADIAPFIRAKAPEHAAFLLENHGPVVAAATLDQAVFAAEELEETAKLLIITRGMEVRHLSPAAIDDLTNTFVKKG